MLEPRAGTAAQPNFARTIQDVQPRRAAEAEFNEDVQRSRTAEVEFNANANANAYPVANPVANATTSDTRLANDKYIATPASKAALADAVVLHDQVQAAESLQRNAAQRDDRLYADQATALRHREMLGDLVQSAKRVAETEGRLDKRDRSIARFLIASANAEATEVERQAGQETALRSEHLMSLRQATGRVREAQQRIEAGRPPLDYRAVRVLVLTRADSRQVSGLRVYALPKDMIDRPERYPAELLRELLHDLTLENLTSPSQGFVPLSDLRIWVGPEFAYDQMQKLVLDKKLVQYKPVHAQSTATTLDLVFFAPDDVPQASAVQ